MTARIPDWPHREVGKAQLEVDRAGDWHCQCEDECKSAASDGARDESGDLLCDYDELAIRLRYASARLERAKRNAMLAHAGHLRDLSADVCLGGVAETMLLYNALTPEEQDLFHDAADGEFSECDACGQERPLFCTDAGAFCLWGCHAHDV